MKKGAVILVIVIVAVAGIFLWIKNSYNGLVKSDEAVNAAWSQVENVYQRRLDLIDNLVKQPLCLTVGNVTFKAAFLPDVVPIDG